MNYESLSTDRAMASQIQAELELWQLLCKTEREAYPWNPAEAESDAYFEHSEFSLFDGLDSEVEDRSQQFFTHLDGLWTNLSTEKASLVEQLMRRFAAQVPQSAIAAIAQKAEQVVSESMSLANQLMACVEEALPQLHAEDLEVLARPLAYAMRGTEADAAIEATLRTVPPVEWVSLTEIEQARLSLAIARYAIAQLQQET